MLRHLTPPLLLVLSLSVAGPALAQDDEVNEVDERPLEVLRVAEAPEIDGSLDDQAWRQVRFVSEFSQRSPEPFGPSPARTEVALAYDARFLYAAFRCNGEPETSLSRRDELIPEADYVMLYVDGSLDRRNARLFAVTAAGVQADGTLSFDLPSRDHSWNSVWRSAVESSSEAGWSAELAIPLSVLGLSGGEPQIGVHFRRYFGDGAVTIERHPIPHTSDTYVSHFEVVGPLIGVTARRSVEVRPFLRVDLRPRVAEGAPLRHEPVKFASGFDLRIGLRGDLGLYLAVLPDFGEAEIDPAVLNLSAYETVNSEQRQLFLEEADLFRFPELTSNWNIRPFQLVHTRRIGAQSAAPELASGEELVQMDDVAPVEAVVRLAGQVRQGTEVGVLTALTGPAQAEIRSDDGARTVEAIGRQYFAAGRVRQTLGQSRSTLGGMVTATGGLDGQGEYALAMDLDFKPSQGNHRLTALGALSVAESELGWGLNVAAGRVGGEGFRWRLIGLALSDGFDVNSMGWLRRDDRLGANLNMGWLFDGLDGVLQQVQIGLFAEAMWNFDGLLSSTHQGLYVNLGIVERDSANAELWISNPHWDDVETRGGPALHRPAEVGGNATIRSAQGRSFGASLCFYGSTSRHGRQIGVNGEVRWSPVRMFRLTLGINYAHVHDAVLWVDDIVGVDGVEVPWLGHLDLGLAQFSLRSTLAITPTLSLQAYVQLLSTAGDYDRFLTLEQSRLLPAPDPSSNYDFDQVVLLANVVLRWEAWPGTVLYVVYTHSGEGVGELGRLSIPAGIGDAAWSNASDLFLIKLELTFF